MSWRQSNEGLTMPAQSNVGACVASNAEVVACQVAALSSARSAHSTDPAKARVIARTIGKAVADEANAQGDSMI